MKKNKPDCFKCKYFYTTWDQRFPRGCRAYNFKTQQIPADYVFRASGQSCLKFEEKDDNKTKIIPKRKDRGGMWA